jgi:anthranilate synthase component II
MKILILDNYDSFSYNLYQFIGAVASPPIVIRNDEITLPGVRALNPDRIVISPGPGSPTDPAYFGVCAAVIRELGPQIPILGVCLGHQGIGHVFGGKVIRAKQVMHGKTSYVYHDDDPLFHGVPRAFEAMRYHSLIVERESLPDCLQITAKTWDDTIMALRHKTYPIYGVQFHPESIGTSVGKQLLKNFIYNERLALAA